MYAYKFQDEILAVFPAKIGCAILRKLLMEEITSVRLTAKA
jgi:hypothetical protein